MIDLYNKKIHYLDPMKRVNHPVATIIVTRLLMALCAIGVIQQKYSELDQSWSDYVVLLEKFQNNGYDCGVYVLLLSEMFAADQSKEDSSYIL